MEMFFLYFLFVLQSVNRSYVISCQPLQCFLEEMSNVSWNKGKGLRDWDNLTEEEFESLSLINKK